MTFDVLEDPSWKFDRDRTFYLAGPMSGYPEYNFDEFERWAEILRRGGLKIASPHEIDHGETPETRGSLPYQNYIDAGMKLLESCGGIILIAGWPQSSGACAELSRAIDRGMPSYYACEYNEQPNNITLLISMNRRPPA
jgi:nucleoside 2-deoxyribosyltransferase